MALGAEGVISVISNIAPRPMAELVKAVADGNLDRARDLHFGLVPLMAAAFVESNPMPSKAALAHMGRVQDVLRLPLVSLAETHRANLFDAIERANETL